MCHDEKKTNPFGRGMFETMRMEDEVQNCEGMTSEMDQLPSVSWSHTDKRSEYEALEKMKDHASEGKQSDSVVVV